MTNTLATDPVVTASANGVTVSVIMSVAVQLVMAFLCGCAIACVYRLVRPRDAVLPTFPATLVLLTVLCALLPLVIGQNVAWAFGLVGALSIVRFRTVVEDTHDITFVIFAVLIGMAVGAGELEVAVVGIVVTGLAAFVVRPGNRVQGWVGGRALCVIRIDANKEPENTFQATLDANTVKSELVSGATAKQGTTLELTYRIRLRSGVDPAAFLTQLNNIDGVQGVSLRQ